MCIATHTYVLSSVFWQEKSRQKKSSSLTWRFKQIDLNLCLCLSREINLVNVYRLLFFFFFKSNLHFDRKNPENWFKFVFWQVKSNKSIWICVKGPFKESYWRYIDQNWGFNSFRVNLFWNLKKTKILFLWKKILFLSIMILLPDFYQLARLADQNHSFFYKTLLE